MRLGRILGLAAGALILGAASLAGGAYWLLRTETPAPEERSAPPVPYLASAAAEQPRVADATVLLEWGATRYPLAVVRTATDQLPNGLALSMAPFLVDWDASEPEGERPFVLVRNVSAGGNPIAGDNLLATTRVPLDGVDELQWCLTPTRNKKGRDTFMGHAMLRFVFDPQQRPVVLDEAGKALSQVYPVDDLMLSWEAWRAPLTSYDGLKGLDPSAYALTARAYTGRQRFLTDVIRGNPWRCYPVRLPDVEGAPGEALRTALLIGDAMARRGLQAMIDNGDLTLEGAEEMAEIPEPELARAASVFSLANLPTDPLTVLVGKTELSYQLLERSCITESLGVLQLALDRIYDEHGLGDAPQMKILPTNLPGWINDLSTADTGTMLSHLPGAVVYAVMNPSIVPARSYHILEDAGLLEPGEDGPLMYYYDPATGTPYGNVKDNMM